MKLGASPDVRHLLMDQHRRLLDVYDKFNAWAYGDSSDIRTKFQIGSVRWANGAIVADVYLVGAGIEVKAAVICYDP